MGLIETLNTLIELCISIQNQLNDLTDLVGQIIHVNRSLVDLSAMDLMSLERNVQILATYREDIDYVIETLQILSGNIKVLFWLLISIVIVVVAGLIFIIIKVIYENRKDILKWICSIYSKILTKF